MVPLRLTLLGGFEARLATGATVILARRKSQALLAYLAVQAGQLQQRDKLAALLWGERTDGQARHSLRQALLAIKQALPIRQGELVGAVRTLKRGLSLCRGFDAPLLAAALGTLLGYVHAMSGRLEEGKPLLDDAVSVLAHNLHSESGSLILLGEAQLLSGCDDDAQSLARRVIALTRERGE